VGPAVLHFLIAWYTFMVQVCGAARGRNDEDELLGVGDTTRNDSGVVVNDGFFVT
jgi:hypothetical protein